MPPQRYVARFKTRAPKAEPISVDWGGPGAAELEPRRRLKEARGPASEPHPGPTELCTPQRGKGTS